MYNAASSASTSAKVLGFQNKGIDEVSAFQITKSCGEDTDD